MQRCERWAAVVLIAATVLGLIAASLRGSDTVSVGAVAPTPTCAVEGADEFCHPFLHRAIPPHGQITMTAKSGQVCGQPIPGGAPHCTTATPPVIVVNTTGVTAFADENADLTIITVTYPYGLIVGTASAQCVVTERQNVAACPAASVTLSAIPMTFTTAPLAPNTWTLISNPFDVPASASLDGPGEIWTWDGSQYSAAGLLAAHQAAWVISDSGSSVRFTADISATAACPANGCP